MRKQDFSAFRLELFSKHSLRLTWRSTCVALLLLIIAVLATACDEGPPAADGLPASAPGAAASDPAAAAPGTVPRPEAQPDPAPIGDGVADKELMAVRADVVAAHNNFGVRLFQELLANETEAGENVFVSPVSVALALSMAWNGAAGATETAMGEALQLSPLLEGGLTRTELLAADSALLRALTAATDDRHVRLNIANSIWHRRELTLNETFRRDNERYYGAQVTGLDFAAPASVAAINDWVRAATEGLIPTVVEQLDPDQVMLLINAVYFKGAWTTPFNPQQTRELPFHRASGATKAVPMMYRDGRIEYYDNGFQAVRLPYGDGRWAMYVFLPPEGTDLRTWAQSLTPETLSEAFDGFAPAYGAVLLPRMDVSYKTRLNGALQALGMGVAFSGGQADFSRMLASTAVDDAGAVRADRNLYLGDVIHQSVLKVDEEGTEAAAVTSVEVRVTSAPLYDFRFQADRPFLVAVRDDATGALLFLGAIMDPGN